LKGNIDKYNIQSGILRKTYQGKDIIITIGHSKSVVSIVTDNTNKWVVGGSLDKSLCVFDLESGQIIHQSYFESCISFMKLHRETNLLAIVTDDLCIRVFDLETRKTIREFWGHESRITDISFSQDGRWVISSSLDSTIRTWDLPSSYLIDVFYVPHIPTSISLSPTGEFLVSTHVDQLGLFVWANRSLYENIPIRNVGSCSIPKASMPLPSGNSIEENVSDTFEEISVDIQKISLEESDEIILSSLPRVKWQNLLSLDSIKVY